MKKTLFVQPRHIYAPLIGEGDGHIYSPTSLWTIGAKLIEAGADIEFADENLRSADTSTFDTVGVNLLGAPYIPLVRERFREVMSGEQQFLVGGQVITGLTRAQLTMLFGEKTMSAPSEVADSVGVAYEKLSQDKFKDECISLIPAYEKISDGDMKEYLDPNREISFYLSQGCVFNCTFCAAMMNMEEKYRDMDIIERDLTYLTERALKFGIHQLNMYLSNLDTFQKPDKLAEFASILHALKRKFPGFVYRVRGLANAVTFRNAVRDNPKVVQSIKDAGFHTVGFGVDGGDERVWRSVKKGHNSEHTIIEAMQGCNEYDIVPEAIMVFGHPVETEESLANTVYLAEQLQKKFRAVPRPHVAKDLIPGNGYWQSASIPTEEWKKIESGFRAYLQALNAVSREDGVAIECLNNKAKKILHDRRARIALLLAHPEYFQAEDFKALASSLSHSNEQQRNTLNEYYTTITEMSGNLRELIYPETAPEFSAEIQDDYHKKNIGRFDR